MIEQDLPHPLSEVISADMCIGCGMCSGICPKSAISMHWSETGMPEPALPDQREINCGNCSVCTEVCPFASGLVSGVELPNETELVLARNPTVTSCQDPAIGYYLTLKAGHCTTFRSSASSGGMATWVIDSLFANGKIDAALCVTEGKDASNSYFDYAVIDDRKDVTKASKTRYYPVSIEATIRHVQMNPGRYAVVGLPCTLKAIRLAQRIDATLRDRIVFLIGIFCGGMKTRHYTEFLAAHAGVRVEDIRHPEYRVKNPDSTADDYSFSCATPDGTLHSVKMQELGDMWGTGLFKPNACDYCDDLTGEVADISVGDAWIPPYRRDGRGTSIIAIRSINAMSLVESGEFSGELCLSNISAEKVNFSQRGNINHRRKGLAYRIHLSKRNGHATPTKRVSQAIPKNLLFALIQKQRIRVRRLSQVAWQAQRAENGTQIFYKIMNPELTKLRRLTYLSHRASELLQQLHRYVRGEK